MRYIEYIVQVRHFNEREWFRVSGYKTETEALNELRTLKKLAERGVQLRAVRHEHQTEVIT